jgi:hypothetical protein
MAAQKKKISMTIPEVAPISEVFEQMSAEASELSEQVVTASQPIADAQETVRAALEKGVVGSRDALVKARAVAGDAANALDLSLAAARDAAAAIGAKMFEVFRVNADANFEFVKSSFSVKSIQDLVALQSEFSRGKVATLGAQAGEIAALTQKGMIDTIAPLRKQIAKATDATA